MIVLAALVLLVTLGVLVTRKLRVSGSASARRDSKRDRAAGGTTRTWVDVALDRWLAAGLLDREQVDAIRVFETSRVPSKASRVPSGRFSPMVEGLGYLGGVLGLVGVMMLVVHYWPDMNVGLRLVLTIGGSVIFLVAGGLVDEEADQAFMRLRWFLWTIGTATIGATGFVLADGVIEFEQDNRTVLAVALPVMVSGGVLWMRRVRPLQEIALWGGLAVSAGAVVADFAGIGWVGVSVAATGLVIATLGWREFVPVPPLTTGLGLLALIPAAGMAADDWRGGALIVSVTVFLMVMVVGAHPGSIRNRGTTVVTSVMGGVGLAQWVGPTIAHFSGEAGIVTGSIVGVVGVSLLVLVDREFVMGELIFGSVGGLALIGGVAITGTQSQSVATLAGLVVAVVLLVVGTSPGRVMASMLGLVSLLIYVPWSIGWFFPGEGRAPLLIAVSGLLIVGAAVIMARMGDRFRRELGGPRGSALHY